jgi:hypothetical protein
MFVCKPLWQCIDVPVFIPFHIYKYDDAVCILKLYFYAIVNSPGIFLFDTFLWHCQNVKPFSSVQFEVVSVELQFALKISKLESNSIPFHL